MADRSRVRHAWSPEWVGKMRYLFWPAVLFALATAALAYEIVSGASPARAATHASAYRLPGPAPSDRVVLVVLDGTRWQEIFLGTDPAQIKKFHGKAASAQHLMPTLHRWMQEDGAVVGAPGHGPAMEASGPNYVSLPGYLEIMTGRVSGCLHNGCGRTTDKTLFDTVEELYPGETRAVGSWEKLERAVSFDEERVPSSFGRHHVHAADRLVTERSIGRALERGAKARAAPGKHDYRPDEHTATLALRVLEEQRPRLMFVGLGDTDEHAHNGNYPAYLRALDRADRFLAELDHTLERMGEAERTTVIVTTDHGRSDSFCHHGAAFQESRRVWLVAKGAGIEARGAVEASAMHHLRDVAPTVRALLGLSNGTEPGAGRAIDELVGGMVVTGAEDDLDAGAR